MDYTEIGSFQMNIFGLEKWEQIDFLDWPFAIPTTELRIQSSEIDTLDMWPQSAPKRKIKYQFELLETALQTSRRGLSVLHCPDFIIELQNDHVKSKFQLVLLSPPNGYKVPKRIKVYLVSRKNMDVGFIEGKLAKFMRSLN